MLRWFRNIFVAVLTVIEALWVSIRYWFITYDQQWIYLVGVTEGVIVGVGVMVGVGSM